MQTNSIFTTVKRLIKPSVFACLTVLSSMSMAADNSLAGGDATTGTQEWADNCSRCHNMRDAKEFTDDEWRQIVLHMRIRAGLTGKQARDILAFLQASNFTPTSMSGGASSVITSDSPTPGLTGKDIYAQTCVACHGADGKGVLPGAPDFTSSSGPLAKTDAVLLEHIINGFQSPGSPMAMPAKGGNANLSNADMKNVLDYIRGEIGK